MNYLIKVAKVQKDNWISAFWMVTGTGVFTTALLTGIMLIAKPDTYFSISILIVPIMLVMTLFAISLWEVIQGFGVAVKFSITRRGFVFSTLAIYTVMPAVMMGYAFLISKLDNVMAAIFWRNIPMEIDLPVTVYMISLLGACYVAVALGFIFGFLMLKFGKNVMWIIWAIYMGVVFLGLPKIHEITALGIDIRVIGIGAAALVIISLIASVFALMRQEIRI